MYVPYPPRMTSSIIGKCGSLRPVSFHDLPFGERKAHLPEGNSTVFESILDLELRVVV